MSFSPSVKLQCLSNHSKSWPSLLGHSRWALLSSRKHALVNAHGLILVVSLCCKAFGIKTEQEASKLEIKSTSAF